MSVNTDYPSFNNGKTGHFAKDYRVVKKGNSR
jgi:hypothetical protein